METLSFVIVGHVDHGKSTLIGRLLYDTGSVPDDRLKEIEKTSRDLGRETEFAYLLDHLEEERQQGITIDTTQVFFKTTDRHYVIIDAPGHVEFVKNMITGASRADAAILIVDVHEGLKEQTKRHAYLISLIGLKQVIVVINKMDLVKYEKERFSQLYREIGAFLSTLHVNLLYCIPISAIYGKNITLRSNEIGWYTGPSFLESLGTLKTRDLNQTSDLVFPVQDLYRVNDKRIIVGRVESGVLKTGADVKVLPGGHLTAVTSIERFLGCGEEAYPGESIGITIRDPLFINRGDIVCYPGSEPTIADQFRANLIWLAKKPLKKGTRITLRCATQEVSCRVSEIARRINSSTLEVMEEQAELLGNLEVGEVSIETKTPIAVAAFKDVQELGRFVLVEDGNICAGGITTGACDL